MVYTVCAIIFTVVVSAATIIAAFSGNNENLKIMRCNCSYCPHNSGNYCDREAILLDSEGKCKELK